MTSTRETKLQDRMAALRIRQEDIRESFTRSSAPGGQNVNKVSSAVVLLHEPTGIQVRCEEERSQAQNRLRARELLVDRIEQRQQAARAAERAEREKIRRQTRKRPRSVQRRILNDKARHAAKKRLRRSAGVE